MGTLVAKQPNGLYCVFSSIVDDFVATDMGRHDVTGFLIDRCDIGKRTAAEKVSNADADLDEGGIAGDGLGRWAECIATIRAVHGARKARRRDLAGRKEG